MNAALPTLVHYAENSQRIAAKMGVRKAYLALNGARVELIIILHVKLVSMFVSPREELHVRSQS